MKVICSIGRDVVSLLWVPVTSHTWKCIGPGSQQFNYVEIRPTIPRDKNSWCLILVTWLTVRDALRSGLSVCLSVRPSVRPFVNLSVVQFQLC